MNKITRIIEWNKSMKRQRKIVQKVTKYYNTE